jgi:hypothetical protein
LRNLHGDQEPPQCQGMLDLTDLASVRSDSLASDHARRSR